MALDLSMLEPWLQPLPDAEGPCGKDLEYDLEFLELMRVAEGKPETQFSAAEPPNWRDVRQGKYKREHRSPHADCAASHPPTARQLQRPDPWPAGTSSRSWTSPLQS